MKRKTLIGAGVFTLLAALSFAGCHHRSPEERIGWFLEDVSERLSLDATQRERLDEMARGFMERKKQMRADRESIRETLMSELRKDRMDRAVIDGVVIEKRRQLDEMADYLVESAIAFHEMLTAEQREKLVGELEKFHVRAEKYGHGRW